MLGRHICMASLLKMTRNQAPRAETVMFKETLGRAGVVLSSCLQKVLLVSSTVLLQEKASLPRSPCFSVPFL